MLNSSIKEGNIIGKIFKGIVHSLTKKKKILIKFNHLLTLTFF